MTTKEEYALWCDQQVDMPIFMQAWWLTGVCAGKHWDVLFSRNEAGEIVAAMPYLIGKKLWYRYILMPQQTQIGGMWIVPAVRDNYASVRAICEDFTKQLAELKLAYYYQHYPVGSIAPEMMGKLGFKVQERVTYRVNDLSNMDEVIAAFSKNKRRQLQKALSLHVDMEVDEETFYQFHTDCLAGQKKAISYTREFFLVMFQKAQKRGCGQIIGIRNADDVLIAAAYVVWDKQALYYLIPCYDVLYKDSGASALLVLEAMKVARKNGVLFDFEGSMIRGVAEHYKQFGSKATPYCSVHKYYRHSFALLLFVNWLRNLKYR